MSARGWMNAADAAALLRVNRATLYAYVSRGFVRSQAMPGANRERGYSRDDVEALRRRTEERRDPDKAAARALQWGVPVLESAITLIDGERLYYRGHDAVMLARTRSVREVAALVWSGRFDLPLEAAHDSSGRHERRVERRLPFVARAQTLLAQSALEDAQALDVRPDRAAIRGWRIVELLVEAATGERPQSAPIEAVLAGTWGLTSRGADVVRAALILCADHELNVSSFTARSVASAGSNLYAVVIAALSALEGPRHGGASARVEAMLTAMRRAPSLRRAMAARLGRGESLEGFGHPLYRHGDPRARALLSLLQERYARSVELTFVRAFVAAATATVGEEPNIDFALAAATRVMRLPAGSPLVLFAVGRAIGWIGHAIEQYATGQLIRPRAKYVGRVPAVP